MSFKANSKLLEKLLSMVFPVIPSKSPLASLENFIMHINEGILTVTASDLEMKISSSMPVQSESNMEVMMPAKTILDAMKSFDDVMVNFRLNDANQLTLETDSGKYAMSIDVTNPEIEFPEVDRGTRFSISAAVLNRGIHLTSYAMSREELRPAMSGTLLELSHEGLRFVTTSGHILVRYINRTVTAETTDSFILPGKAVSVLQKLFTQGDVTFYPGSGAVTFANDTVEFSTRLINDKYPDYNSVIPKDNNQNLILETSKIASAVKRMLIFAEPTFKAIRMNIKENTILEVSANDTARGANALETLYCRYTGEPIDIAFNGTYLLEILGSIEDSEVIVKLDKPNKAGILTPSKDKENEELLVLLMPIRLNR
ncbi:MAG: DNA polymerase III subunit beta [Ignavibacteriaceae bacterium]|nr:DNA polymerase III subunit beta [Ignavibacteriaceae bacterium]